MDIDNFIKEKSEIIMWILHIFIFLYLYGDGTVFSKNVNEMFIYVALGASLYIYIKMHKALVAEQTKPPKVEYIKPPVPSTLPQGKPFDFDTEVKENEPKPNN